MRDVSSITGQWLRRHLEREAERAGAAAAAPTNGGALPAEAPAGPRRGEDGARAARARRVIRVVGARENEGQSYGLRVEWGWRF